MLYSIEKPSLAKIFTSSFYGLVPSSEASRSQACSSLVKQCLDICHFQCSGEVLRSEARMQFSGVRRSVEMLSAVKYGFYRPFYKFSATHSEVVPTNA